jgi:hypothetical protein
MRRRRIENKIPLLGQIAHSRNESCKRQQQKQQLAVT